MKTARDTAGERALGQSASSAPRRSAPRAPRPTQLYDVVVIGNDLPGLVAGALLAKKGLRVLHVDNGAPHDHHLSGGFRLPCAPTPLPPPRASRALHALAEDLGVLPMVGRAMAPVAGGLQLLLPAARLSLGSAPDARRLELERAFSGPGTDTAGAVERALSVAAPASELLGAAPPLPAGGLLEAWKASRYSGRAAAKLGGLQADDPVLEAIAGLHRFSARLEDEGTAFAFGLATAPWLFDAARPPDDGLIALLRTSIRNYRGDSLGDPDEPAQVSEVVVEGGRFAGVRLEGHDGGVHRGRIGLAACALEALAPLLPSARMQTAVERHADRLPARRHVETWNLVLAAEGIPMGLGELAAVVDPDGGLTLLLREPARREDGQPADGLVTVSAARIARGETVDAGVPADGALDAALEEALPFHGRHLRLKIRSPASLPIYRAPEEGPLASLPLRSPVRRLLVGNRASLPGLGLEGSLLAGRRLAGLAEDEARKVKL